MFNEADRKMMKQTIESWIATDNRPADIVVLFRAPKGDGAGVKRFTGPVAEAASSALMFCLKLQEDGGTFVFAELQTPGFEGTLHKSEWLKCVEDSGVLKGGA